MSLSLSLSLSLALSRSPPLSLSLSLSRSRSRSLMIVPGARAGPDKGAGVADDEPGPATDIMRPCVKLFPRSRSLSGGCKLDMTGGWVGSDRETQRWGAGGPGTDTGGIEGPLVEPGGGRGGADGCWYGG